MFEELYVALPDTDAYLKRINFTAPQRLNRETLDALILHHLMAVPFENLDVAELDLEVSLATVDLFDKLVTRRRGGYCFEANALFMGLCQSLGFSCQALVGRVMWNKDFYPQPGHRASVVTINGRRLFCDVGYGGPTPCETLDMDTDAVQKTIGGDFAFQPHPNGLLLVKYIDGVPRPLILIDERPADPVDFIPLNFFYSRSPISVFRAKPIVNIKTQTGSIAIDGDTLRFHVNGTLREEQLATPQQRAQALKTHFGIVL